MVRFRALHPDLNNLDMCVIDAEFVVDGMPYKTSVALNHNPNVYETIDTVNCLLEEMENAIAKIKEVTDDG